MGGRIKWEKYKGEAGWEKEERRRLGGRKKGDGATCPGGGRCQWEVASRSGSLGCYH